MNCARALTTPEVVRCTTRFTSGFEVDFILNGMTAIEGKGKEVAGERDVRGLRALREEGLLRNYLVVSCERRPRVTDGISSSAGGFP